MYLATLCANCQLEKYRCICKINKGLYWEETSKKFYTFEELKEFYKKKAEKND